MAGSTDISNKPIFSPTNVLIIIGFVSSFFANQFFTKMQIQELFLNAKSENRINDMRFAALEKQDAIHDLTLKTMADAIGNMMKPDEIEIKKYRK